VSPYKRLSGFIGLAVTVAILGVALWFLHRELAELTLAEIGAQIRGIPVFALLASLCAAAGSYYVLSVYDGLALRYLGKSIPYKKYGLISFMAYAIGQNVGIAALTGGSVRYRMYTLEGLSATEIALVILFVTVTFALGSTVLLGVSLLLMPAGEAAALTLGPGHLHIAGAVLILIPVAYLAIAALRSAPIDLRSWRIVPPSLGIAVGQLVASVADLLLAALSLYVLLAPLIDIGFFRFLGIFLIAMFGGIISSVPAGLGVFEAVLVAMLPQASASALLGTVIVFRLIYYVVPLSVALTILTLNELHQQRIAIQRSVEQAGQLLASVAPQAASVIVFIAGIVLLISGSSPAITSRVLLIGQLLPLPILEVSHLAGSIIGAVLLVLARGLYQRLHTALLATLVALGLGIVFSLLKGLDYEEALILSLIAAVLWVERHRFYREGSARSVPVSTHWLAAVLLVMCGVIWVVLVSFRDVPYSQELWWQFAFDADAPRALRAGLMAGVTLMIVTFSLLLRAASDHVGTIAPAPDKENIRRVLETAHDSSANVALLEGQRFIWAPEEQAFIMYQMSGNSWIAYGDPVGPESQAEELVWKFRELVDRHNGRPVFYQVSDQSLPLYVDLGLSLYKLGEDGRVDLTSFSLEGSQRAGLRHSVNRARREGAEFEVIGRDRVAGALSELRIVSDDWLAGKAAAEKGFSLGHFSEPYLANFDCAVVRVNNRIVAFANLWSAPAVSELSIDLMRHSREAPKGVMDYLFCELMLWGSASGYRWFNLGMAPLAGMEERALAPLWHKLGNLVFTHSESFYNFEGLRSYKEKFDPVWSPRYLACPGGWFDLPLALLDTSRLISGGVVRSFKKH